jgi:hypothetical protein
MNKKKTDFYKPIIIKDLKVDAIAGETIPSGQKGVFIVKLFVSSLDQGFEKICNSITQLLLGSPQGDSINKLLALIKQDGTGYIYPEHFPLSLEARAKRSIKAGEVVSKTDLIDIIGIMFVDSVFDLNVEDGDKLVWLFRIDWKFGLFFDFSGKLKADKLSKELANYYRRLLYFDIYMFLENQHNFDSLIQDGWFPFIGLVTEHFQNLIQYYSEEKKFILHIGKILNYFTKAKIDKMTHNWWDNYIFNDKRSLIETGINAYLQDTTAGYISSIKILSSEIEGIIRINYVREYGRNPTTQELKQYLIDKGKAKFSAIGSLGFPGLFYNYLNEVLFKGFDLMTDDVPISRHSVAHGVAEAEAYQKVRAFQLILVLDQIYFFLGTT